MLPQAGPKRDSPRIHLGFTLICLPAWHRWHYLRPLDRLAVVRREAYLPKQRRLGIVLLLLAKSWAGMGKPLSLVLKLVLSKPRRYAAHAWMYTVQKRISWRWRLLACCSSTASSDCMQSSQRASNTATAFREAAHVQASVTSSHVQVTSPRLARQLVSW